MSKAQESKPITIKAADLRNAIPLLAPAISAGATIWGAHLNLWIPNNHPNVILMANNGFAQIEVEVPVVFDEQTTIECTVPWEPFRQAVLGMLGEVTMTRAKARLNLADSHISASINTYSDPPHYDRILHGDGVPTTVDATLLRGAYDRVRRACNPASNLPIHNSIHFICEPPDIALLATDGYVGAWSSLTMVPGPHDRLVHSWTATIPARLIDGLFGAEGGIDLYITESHMTAISDELRWRAVQSDIPKYPDFRAQFGEAPAEAMATINRQLLHRIATQADVFGHRKVLKTSDVDLFISPDNQAVTVSTSGPDAGDFQARMDAEVSIEADDAAVILDGAYLKDALSTFGAEKVDIEITNHGRVLRVSDGESTFVITGKVRK